MDSLEIVVSDWTPGRVAKASDEELLHLVYDWHGLMLGYSNINCELSQYYGKKVFNTSVRKGWKAMTWASAKVIGQYFWAKEQYDSAAFYYKTALRTIETIELGAVDVERPNGWTQFDIDNGLSYMYGTMGNLYSAMDSIGLAMEYYEMAGEIFERNGWDQALSCLHYNMAETLFGAGDMAPAKQNYLSGLSYAEEAFQSRRLRTRCS